MHSLENIKKFVRDNEKRLGEEAARILKRAEGSSQDGVFSGNALTYIMLNEKLTTEFRQAVMTDPEHLKLTRSALQATI